jgi:hypothetical protein
MVVLVANVSYERAFTVGRITRAVFAPLAVAALAYGLSWVSDRLLFIGPLDRAAFGWAVVIPVWLAAPSVAALRWRRMTFRERSIAAAVVGTVIGVVAAYSYWLSVAFPDCETGAIFTPAERVLPAIIVGAVVGAAPAIGGLVEGGRSAGRCLDDHDPRGGRWFRGEPAGVCRPRYVPIRGSVPATRLSASRTSVTPLAWLPRRRRPRTRRGAR